jgi:hypothetical protein
VASSAVFAWDPPLILRTVTGIRTSCAEELVLKGHVRAVENDQQFSFPGFETSQRHVKVVVIAVERHCAAQQRT